MPSIFKKSKFFVSGLLLFSIIVSQGVGLFSPPIVSAQVGGQPETTMMDVNDLEFSQLDAGEHLSPEGLKYFAEKGIDPKGMTDVDYLYHSMKESGWKGEGIRVVRITDPTGKVHFVAYDNTRPLVWRALACEGGNTQIPVKIYDENMRASKTERGKHLTFNQDRLGNKALNDQVFSGNPKNATWGDVVRIRMTTPRTPVETSRGGSKLLSKMTDVEALAWYEENGHGYGFKTIKNVNSKMKLEKICPPIETPGGGNTKTPPPPDIETPGGSSKSKLSSGARTTPTRGPRFDPCYKVGLLTAVEEILNLIGFMIWYHGMMEDFMGPSPWEIEELEDEDRSVLDAEFQTRLELRQLAKTIKRLSEEFEIERLIERFRENDNKENQEALDSAVKGLKSVIENAKAKKEYLDELFERYGHIFKKYGVEYKSKTGDELSYSYDFKDCDPKVIYTMDAVREKTGLDTRMVAFDKFEVRVSKSTRSSLITALRDVSNRYSVAFRLSSGEIIRPGSKGILQNLFNRFTTVSSPNASQPTRSTQPTTPTYYSPTSYQPGAPSSAPPTPSGLRFAPIQ